MKKKNQGSLFILIAALLWSLGGVGTKFIPWQPLSIASIRGILAAIVLLCFRKGAKIHFTRSTICGALCVFTTTVLFMFANKLTTAANAIVLQYMAPVYVLIGVMLVQKKRPKWIDMITILLTFTGIILFFVDHLGSGKTLGDVLAILSGVSFAGVFFFNDLPDSYPQDANLIGCSLSMLLLPFVFTDSAVVQGGSSPWIAAILLGIVQLGFAYYFFGKGISEVGPVSASIIAIVEPVLNPIWVFLLLQEKPGPLSIFGAAIVIFTILLYNIFPQLRETISRISRSKKES